MPTCEYTVYWYNDIIICTRDFSLVHVTTLFKKSIYTAWLMYLTLCSTKIILLIIILYNNINTMQTDYYN